METLGFSAVGSPLPLPYCPHPQAGFTARAISKHLDPVQTATEQKPHFHQDFSQAATDVCRYNSTWPSRLAWKAGATWVICVKVAPILTR